MLAHVQHSTLPHAVYNYSAYNKSAKRGLLIAYSLDATFCGCFTESAYEPMVHGPNLYVRWSKKLRLLSLCQDYDIH